MNKFGKSSLKRLDGLENDLLLLCYDVLVHLNISILCTARDEDNQNKAFLNGTSKARWGESPHNFELSRAVDVALWNNGIDYTNKNAFKRVVDCFKLHAKYRGIEIECGYDWGWDMPHIQLKKWEELV